MLPLSVNTPLVAVEGLSQHFALVGGVFDRALGRQRRVVYAVDDVDVSIDRGEALGLRWSDLILTAHGRRSDRQ